MSEECASCGMGIDESFECRVSFHTESKPESLSRWVGVETESVCLICAYELKKLVREQRDLTRRETQIINDNLFDLYE